tara:strand:- start:490 stop:828 length:339 start_codon:yes stop_codon:yes gene_type:complete
MASTPQGFFYLISLEDNMSSSSARDRANRNNPYWQTFTELIDDRIEDGHYSAEYRYEYNPNEDEKTQMRVAAEAICNYHKYSDVQFDIDSYYDDDDDEIFIVSFSWDEFQYT